MYKQLVELVNTVILKGKKGKMIQNDEFIDKTLVEELERNGGVFNYNHTYGACLSEMSKFDVAFLHGCIKKFKPKSMLEIGVAAGATTSMILDVFKNFFINCKLISLDKSECYYRLPTEKTGFFALSKHSKKQNWKLITGKILPDIMDDVIKEKFDMILLDTAHTLPGELFDWPIA